MCVVARKDSRKNEFDKYQKRLVLFVPKVAKASSANSNSYCQFLEKKTCLIEVQFYSGLQNWREKD